MSEKDNQNIERNFAPVLLCPPQIPHDLTQARTRAAADYRLSYGMAKVQTYSSQGLLVCLVPFIAVTWFTVFICNFK
jgi:hypothetical protein